MQMQRLKLGLTACVPVHLVQVQGLAPHWRKRKRRWRSTASQVRNGVPSAVDELVGASCDLKVHQLPQMPMDGRAIVGYCRPQGAVEK
eukprot:1146288-Pelagomonas_calceolata.AAC.1